MWQFMSVLIAWKKYTCGFQNIILRPFENSDMLIRKINFKREIGNQIESFGTIYRIVKITLTVFLLFYMNQGFMASVVVDYFVLYQLIILLLFLLYWPIISKLSAVQLSQVVKVRLSLLYGNTYSPINMWIKLHTEIGTYIDKICVN